MPPLADNITQFVQRQYFQQVPLRKFRFRQLENDDQELQAVCSLRIQQELFSHTFSKSTDVGISIHYMVNILKRYILLIEQSNQEIDDNILNTMISNISVPALPADIPQRVHYLLEPYGSSTFVIQESRNILGSSGMTGFRTWEAALALGEYIVKNSMKVGLRENTRILELGAGTGFISILCSRLGVKNILATDGYEDVINVLKSNIEINHLGSSIQTRRLIWGDKQDENHEILQTFQFDLILGADITYDTELCETLTDTILQIFRKNKQAKAIISITERRTDTLEYFEKLLKSKHIRSVWTYAPSNNDLFFYVSDNPIVRLYFLQFSDPSQVNFSR
ncbi:putative methyltransferase-domain-containing protein [Dipodascopsis uninucleata]